jgi:hypothetical protein
VSLPAPPKKPLIKRWWFWALIVVAVFFLIGALSSAGDSTSTADSEASPSASEPKEIIGGNLKDAIDAFLAAGFDEGSITVVGWATMYNENVYEGNLFSIDNLGDEDFQRSQIVCGTREGASGSNSVIIWAETSCADAEAQIAERQAAASSGSGDQAQPNDTGVGGDSFVMPSVVGMVLQDAQNLLQSSGSYLMDQVDATGQGRFQVLDSNWKVCSQSPSAGASVTTGQMVTLSAVKLDESC